MRDYGPPQETADADRAARPKLHDLLAALAFLTALPIERPNEKSRALARATLFFPLVGLFTGGLLAGASWALAAQLPRWLLAVLLVAFWEALTRAEALRTMPGAAIIVLLKAFVLSLPGATNTAGLLFAPLLGCWSMVVLATGARDLRVAGHKLNSAITFREFALTSVFTFAFVLTLGEALGILIVVCAGAVTLALRLLFHRWPGGVSWPLLRTSALFIEALTLGLFALL